MSIRFDFSNLPCKIVPQFERYLYLLYSTNSDFNESDELNMFLSGFSGEGDESFVVLFSNLDKNTVQVVGIASAVYRDNTPSVWALATHFFSKNAELDFYLNKRGMPLKAFIAYWQDFVINDMRNEVVVPVNGLPAITFDDAFNNILSNRKMKREAAIRNEQLFIEPTQISRLA